MSTCCFPTHQKTQKSDRKSRTNMKAEQISPQLTSTWMVLHATHGHSPVFSAFARVSYLLRQRWVNQLRWKSVCERLVPPVCVFVSEWYTTLWCCFSTQLALYKSFYSLASSLKDSGHIRPRGACVKCSCCQHDCGHSRGQRYPDPLAKERVPSFNTMNRGLCFVLTYIHTCAFLSHFPKTLIQYNSLRRTPSLSEIHTRANS